MKKHYCKHCNYQTDLLFNYNKHLKTTRHQKNLTTNQNESLTNQNESLTNHFESLTNQNESLKMITCSYCNYSTKYKQNYNRHFLKCSVRLQSDNNKDLVIKKLLKEVDVLKHDETILDKQSSQILQLTETINQLKTQNTVNVLSTENKLLKEHNKHVTNNSNSGNIGNNNSNHIQNITQYIKNTYPNAPNVKPIDKIDNVEQYIGYDCNDAYTNLIHDHYLKDIDPKDRSIWLVDSARDKYLTRLNDNWKIDINGEQFCKLVNNAISKAIHQGKDQITSPQAQMSLVLLELVIYVSNQPKMPKNKKSQFLIQNIEDWKELGDKLREREQLTDENLEIVEGGVNIVD